MNLTGVGKGKMLVNLLFMTEGTGTLVQCQLDTGATCVVRYYESEKSQGDKKHGAYPSVWWQSHWSNG
jgi:hypothetical protein